MKKKIFLLAMVSGLAAISCNKIYQCKDEQTGIIIGEVGARSQSKANSMCKSNNQDKATAAIKK